VSACWEKRNELRKMRGKKKETFIAVIGFIILMGLHSNII
jgi:hypothetical protein